MRLFSALLLLLPLFLPDATAQRPISGIVLMNDCTIRTNKTHNVSGIIYDMFTEVTSRMRITPNYTVMNLLPLNKSLPELVNNRTIDFLLGYPLVNTDVNFDLLYENVARINLLSERMFIFRPNLLQLLVVNVMKEMFFVFVIMLIPWFLSAIALYYLIEIRRFWKKDFFTGFYEAFMVVVYRADSMSQFGRAYSLVFYFLTAIMGMLLLGDFIYVIAAMLLKSDIDNVNEFISTQTRICTVKGDYLVDEFMSRRQEISVYKTTDLMDCFSKLGYFEIGSIFVSESRIKAFFHENPSQNNKFDFFSRDSVHMEYYALVRNDIRVDDRMRSIMEELQQKFIPALTEEYFERPKFNQITPTSIFSDSILLIFTSLTITSLFLIFFLVALICRQRKGPISKRNNTHKLFDKNDKKDRENKGKKYKPLRQKSKNSGHRPRDNQYTDIEEGNYLANHQQGNQDQVYNQNEEKDGKYSPYAKSIQKNSVKGPRDNHTLSLSGPIQLKKFEGKPEKSWLKIGAHSSGEEGSFRFQGTSDFENQVSAVEKAHETKRSHHSEYD